LPLLADSKKLSAKRREIAFVAILDFAKKGNLFFGVGIAEREVIDTINIKQANKAAMNQALSELAKNLNLTKPKKIMVDGNDNYIFNGITLPAEFIIKGDTKIAQIKAASIVAKVWRDHLMVEYAKKYPEYGFDIHKGYGTKRHQQALEKYGVTEIHRKSFAPIRKIICESQNLSERLAEK